MHSLIVPHSRAQPKILADFQRKGVTPQELVQRRLQLPLCAQCRYIAPANAAAILGSGAPLARPPATRFRHPAPQTFSPAALPLHTSAPADSRTQLPGPQGSGGHRIREDYEPGSGALA
ncbi:hypothetical protein NDU88_005465 [Pleurodeles waltl]|uniref:Uncharacterized protein n=1 Tax=Pleurodeles waltl TaxID=8319 RepID=A0AAV7TUE6_PLEWA|nr:hypothetical protein NDU88_005465 [Pleurodeles waltl]